ncbi:hypothetical protein D3C72_2198750 [compost metagenome]
MLIACHHPDLHEFIQECIAIHVVRGEEFHLDLLRPVFKTAFAIGNRPQPDEEQASFIGQLNQVRVTEEAWFDVSCAGHYWFLQALPSWAMHHSALDQERWTCR